MGSAVEGNDSTQGEVAALRGELCALKSSLVSDDLAAPIDWKLSRQERRIFGMLLAQDVVSKRTIALLLRGREATAADLKSLDVFISRIRSKTSCRGVKIETIFGVGYRLDGRESWRASIQSGANARH